MPCGVHRVSPLERDEPRWGEGTGLRQDTSVHAASRGVDCIGWRTLQSSSGDGVGNQPKRRACERIVARRPPIAARGQQRVSSTLGDTRVASRCQVSREPSRHLRPVPTSLAFSRRRLRSLHSTLSRRSVARVMQCRNLLRES